MITEDYVTIETAKLMSSKGFDEKLPNSINLFKGNTYEIDGKTIVADDDVSIPTQSSAMKWLRKKHGLHIEIIADRNNSTFYVDIAKKEGDGWNGEVRDTFLVYTGKTIFEEDFDEPEDAAEAAIDYCLKKLI